MDGRMDNRCRLIEAYAHQADFEMGGRLVAIQFMRASVVKDVYTARYLYLCRSYLIHSAKARSYTVAAAGRQTRSVD